MKSIKVSNSHYLHVYLIEHKHEDFLDSVREIESKEMDVAFDANDYNTFKKSAKDFMEVMGEEHCVALLDAFIEEMMREVVDSWKENYSPRLKEPKYKAYLEFLENGKNLSEGIDKTQE
jgi:hypothetical protein